MLKTKTELNSLRHPGRNQIHRIGRSPGRSIPAYAL